MDVSLNKSMNLYQTGLLYNPQLQSAEMAEKLFVVRQKQFELLLNKILQEKENSIPQHYLVIGQRGMGKTTLLKRMEVELHKEQYRQRFIPLLYREEQYNVKDLAEFWLNTLDALADSLQSEKYSSGMITDIDKTIREISGKSPKIIVEEAYKYLMSICDNKLHRRPILLVDNIGLIFGRLDNDKKSKTEQWTLRKLISENGAPVVVGGGVTLTDDVNNYNMPFYDFFQIQQLYKLSYEEFTKLLINLATVTNSDKTVFASIQKNSSRQQSLLALTGGSPRLTVMLFEQIVKGFSSNIYDDLEILADAITPLYKARFEELPTQQQIILDAIALNWDAISLNKLSKATRIQNNQLSPQLKRLVDAGWLEITPAYKAKGNAYFISERFFNIYYLIRNSSRRYKDKIYCLSKFLECFYGKEELDRISDTLSKQDIHSAKEMQLQMAFWNIKTLDIDEHRRQLGLENMSKAFLESKELRKEFDFPEEAFLFAEGYKLFTEERYEDAIGCFDKAIEINPENTLVLGSKGEVFIELEQYEKAIICFDEILKIDAKNDSAWIRKGEIFSRLKKYNDAVACLDKATKLNPQNEYAWMRRGEIFYNFGKYSDALNCFDEVLKLNPNFEPAWFFKGLVLSELEYYKDAVLCFDRCIESNPKEVMFWYNKGKALIDLQQYKDAINCFDEAIKLKPKENDDLLFFKSHCLYFLRLYEKAVACLDKAIKLNPQNEYYWACKGLALDLLQRFTESVDCHEQAIKIKPENDSFWHNKGEALLFLDNYEEANMCYEETKKINPRNESAWLGNGICLNNMKKFKDAIDSLDKAIELNINNGRTWFWKAECLLELERYEEAIKCYDKATKLDDNYQAAWSNKGFALIEVKDYDEAAIAYEKSSSIYPQELLPKFHLIFLYRDKLEKRDKAIEIHNSMEKDINADENKEYVSRFYLDKTLFELYKKNEGLAQEHLLQSFEVLEKENKLSSMANENYWIKFGSVIEDISYGSWLLAVLKEKGYDIMLSPYYTAIQALEIEKQDGKDGEKTAEIYLKNVATEISAPARIIIDRMRRYMS